VKVRGAAWHRANAEKVKERKRREKARRWRQSPAERALSYANVAKRRASKLQRTPAWANAELIALIYETASACNQGCSRGEAFVHVDHVIPLQGRLVSGLHVHENLRLISETRN
jgi:hypothetical protein